MAVGSIASAVIGNKGASKAAKAQIQAAQMTTDLAREQYGRNEQNLSPFMQTGLQASGAINALLGLPAVQAQAAQAPAEAPPSGYGLGNFIGGAFDNLFGRGVSPKGAAPQAQAIGTATAPPAQPSYQQAFDNYRNSTGYRFRLGEGMNALNSGYAGAGTIQSGAAMKSAMDYAQNMASGEFGNYLNALGNQQGIGLQGASALAGVGQNMVNTIGGANQSAADARSNAAMVKAQNTSQAVQAGVNAAARIIGGGF
jgi:hypothetical protein